MTDPQQNAGAVVTYHRYTVERVYECETLEQALGFLASGEEHGELSSFASKIVLPDRTVEGEELRALVDEKWEKMQG